MGHKVHPTIYRTPLIYTWDSKWFAKKKNAPKFLEQDITIREYLQKKLKDAGIDAIGIERTPQDLTVNILAAKPGVIIGRNGQGLEDIRKVLEKKYLQFIKHFNLLRPSLFVRCFKDQRNIIKTLIVHDKTEGVNANEAHPEAIMSVNPCCKIFL